MSIPAPASGDPQVSDHQVTATPFPAAGRPLLWWPRARQVALALLVALLVFGLPPASSMQAAQPAGGLPNDWERPASGQVLRDFSQPPAPWAAGHRGVDLALSPGGEIRAPAGGVVSFSGVVVDREVLSIDHGAGLVSSFEPVESELEVGDSVSAGAVVATLGTYDGGSAHCDGQPCLHWGVRHHGEYINPLLLTGDLEPSVLLPLAQGTP